MNRVFVAITIMAGLILTFQSRAMGHAFLDHAEPKVGSEIDKPPTEVKVWFTHELEPAFSVIQVFDADGNEVDKKDSHLDEKDKTLLSVSMADAPAGVYKVVWHVVCTDTHKTNGDFKFTIKAQG